jgi:hypothetical protein
MWCIACNETEPTECGVSHVMRQNRQTECTLFTLMFYLLTIKPTSCTNSSNLFWSETLHVSDSSSVHHQELFTVHSAMVYGIQVCRQLSSRIRMELQFHPDPAHPAVDHTVSSTSCHRPDCLYGCIKAIPQNCMYSLPEDEHLNVRNMSKTL